VPQLAHNRTGSGALPPLGAARVVVDPTAVPHPCAIPLTGIPRRWPRAGSTDRAGWASPAASSPLTLARPRWRACLAGRTHAPRHRWAMA